MADPIIKFHAGTVEIHGLSDAGLLPDSCIYDTRSGCFRAAAVNYESVVMRFHRAKLTYVDEARQYLELQDGLRVLREPRPYQKEALEAFRAARYRGVVVLPTGAGKTYVAQLAIDATRRSTLVVAPTLDLVRQWYDGLRIAFDREVGIVGGGEYNLHALTVTTYDSAYLHMENFGDRFGLVIFDECHHLPGAGYQFAARSCLAPFRLGLTATPERSDGGEELFPELIGPIVYRRDVSELAGEYLAPYDVFRIQVELTPDERQAYQEARDEYRSFVVSQGIRMSRPDGWATFIRQSARSADGRSAMRAYRRQRELSFAAPSKLDYVAHLLNQHRGDQVLIFTQNNDTAYEVSKRFLVPVITHQTKIKERSELLQGFADGTFGVLATSKVLNEGVDVPEANVAIIMSGSGSVREHVQRLGRILRLGEDKRATLYELVAAGTAEQHTSERRREHNAYR